MFSKNKNGDFYEFFAFTYIFSDRFIINSSFSNMHRYDNVIYCSIVLSSGVVLYKNSFPRTSFLLHL